ARAPGRTTTSRTRPRTVAAFRASRCDRQRFVQCAAEPIVPPPSSRCEQFFLRVENCPTPDGILNRATDGHARCETRVTFVSADEMIVSGRVRALRGV